MVVYHGFPSCARQAAHSEGSNPNRSSSLLRRDADTPPQPSDGIGGVHRSGHASKAGWSVAGAQPPIVALHPWLCRQSQPTILTMAVTCQKHE